MMERHLPPLPCVIWKDLTGEYWRFHHEGHSAVSTVEAIAHTARTRQTTRSCKSSTILYLLQKEVGPSIYLSIRLERKVVSEQEALDNTSC
jgi:hypothetical protein